MPLLKFEYNQFSEANTKPYAKRLYTVGCELGPHPTPPQGGLCDEKKEGKKL
jgi:hypothetical protein